MQPKRVHLGWWVWGVATTGGILFVIQAVLIAWVTESSPNPRILALQVAAWWAWGILAPPIFALCRRVPVARPRIGFAVGVHSVAALLASVAHTLVLAPLTLWALGPVPATVNPFYIVVVRTLGYRVGSDVIMYALIAAAWHAFVYHGELRQRAVTEARLQQALAESELRALRSQLQPHFVSNALNAIAAFVREDPATAEDMIVRLNRYFRSVLAASSAQRVPVEQEIALAKQYLAIHQLRFGERLQVRVAVEDGTQRALLPVLLLQPLVENALQHGIGTRTGPGHLHIGVRRAGERLEVEVEDNGDVAISGVTRDAFPRGIGLSNSEGRLSLLYGDRYSMSVSRAAHGTSVRVSLPYEEAGAA